MLRRGALLLAGVSIASLLTASGQQPVGVLDVERRVRIAIGEAGSAKLIRAAAEIPGLPAADPAVQALAALRLHAAQGMASRAFPAILRALRDRSAGNTELAAALYRDLVHYGPGEQGRVFLAADGDELHRAARALDLAQAGHCDQARRLLQDLASWRPEGVEASLLLAETMAVCDQRLAALGLLDRLADGRGPAKVDPRVALMAGEVLLAVEDEPSAAYWCSLAGDLAGSNPRLQRRAAVCRLSAEALLGRLPAARVELVAALRRALIDPALDLSVRRQSGLDAAWVLLRTREAADARTALEILNRVASLEPTTEVLRTVEVLRALALTRLERAGEARRALQRARASADDPRWMSLLRAIVESWVDLQQGDEVSASSRLSRAAEVARAAGSSRWLAVVEMDRAVQARWGGRRPLAKVHAQAALAAWPGAGMPGERLVDPVLPRRALELSLAAGVPQKVESSSRSEVRLEEAEKLRTTLDPALRLAGGGPEPSASRIRRYLAARNTGLIYYVIGETRTFAWLMEPGITRAVEMPAGDQLFEAAASLAAPAPGVAAVEAASQILLGGLLDSYSAEEGLMICPDGFLLAVPWGALVPPEVARARPDQRRLDAEMHVALVGSLSGVIDPAGTRVRLERERTGFVALVSRPVPGLPGTSLAPSEAFAPAVVLGPAPDLAARARRTLRGLGGVVHLALPLLAGGKRTGEIALVLPSGRPDQPPAITSCEELFEIGEGPSLVAMAPAGGWARHPASWVRAAMRTTALGARAALVPLASLAPRDAKIFWPAFYEELGAGRSKIEALADARRRLEATGGETAAEFSFIGYGDTRVVAAPRVVWPFWVSLGAGLAILALVFLRAVWPRRDPFDEEPPEE